MNGDSSQLNSEELARYSRHILLDEIGIDGQERLKKAKVLVVGAGGLGSPAAMYLVAAGVGQLGIADFDKVELHNLQRQLLHGTADVDTPKTLSAQKRLQAINPHVSIVLHEGGVQADNAVELFKSYDVIVDGTDNFATRYLNNDASFFAGKPLVYGSIFKFEGQVSLFNASPEAPCYRCLFPEPPPPGSVPNCGEAGVLGALCGIIGSMQALEAVKTIVGAGESLAASLFTIDTLSMRTRKLKIKKDPQCPLCSPAASINSINADRYEDQCETNTTETMPSAYPIEVDIQEAKNLLDSSNTNLIDVRETFELGICQIENARHIPMNTIPQHLEELPKEGPLLIQCHHGGRSLQVVHYLRQNGFDNAINMGGGIDAWAINHDATMQRY
jgi:molybdopterin/thiamine biosynthesis adenylyltransferase/rhodanese-related sulfurtransferase|tara:strand:+ start:2775 stop:3938 length:1164 start_codon:yes stop_codon:yes gene_type:complete